MAHILLLEDDESLIDGLKYSLEKNGFEIKTVRTVEEAWKRAVSETFDLLLLDVSLPDGSGFEVCERVRKAGKAVPIIFLTAMDEEVHVIRGLDSGGDDYITKPFKLGELCSRIRALLRRAGVKQEDINLARLVSGDLTMDLFASRVWKNKTALELTGGEFRLLGLLMRNEGRVLTRAVILNELWDGSGEYVDDNTLSVYIRRLREKLEEDPSSPRRLLTVRGFGYRWNAITGDQ